MSMQLRVVHSTTFEYDGKAAASYNQARLQPITSADQILVHSRLVVEPKPWTFEYRDYFGNHVNAFEVLDPHNHMTVTATSTVQVNRPEPSAPVTTWEELARPEVSDRWTEFLMQPDLIVPPDDFAQRAKQIAADHELPGDAARDLCAMVHDEVEFVPGSTDVESPAADAWRQRAGVCQDMVHLVLGGLRTIGIPARYVSGYVHPVKDPVIGESVAGDSHAWVEWWDDGWQAFDLTADFPPNDRYVAVAVGRDYRDVKPLSGIYAGSETTEMSVEVELTRLA